MPGWRLYQSRPRVSHNVLRPGRSLRRGSLTPIRELAANDLYYDDRGTRDLTFLSRPARLLEMDFNSAREAACRSRVRVRIRESGLCHGWVGWFRMRLSGRWLSTSPEVYRTGIDRKDDPRHDASLTGWRQSPDQGFGSARSVYVANHAGIIGRAPASKAISVK
jgi:hypothetical protein